MYSLKAVTTRTVFALLLLALGFVPAATADTEFRLLLDLDSTGDECTVATAGGPVGQIDQVVITAVDTDVNPPMVTGVSRQTCVAGALVADATFSPIPPLTWPVGVGNGLTSATLDLVELYAPLPAPPTASQIHWTLTATVIGNPSLGDAMAATPIDWASVTDVPTLGQWGLALLVLILAISGATVVRRRGARGALVVFLLLTVGAGIAWAAIVRDGNKTDWTGIPNYATDPANDGILNAELVAASAVIEGNVLFVGVDADFTLDDSPAVLSSTPANGATGVALNSNITITFTENVNVTASAFALQCLAPVAFTVTPAPPGGTNSFILDPTTDLPAGTTCMVSVNGSQVTDTDANDPPDTMAGNASFSFTTNAPPVAVNDTATVSEDASATAVSVLVNDTDAEGDAFTIASGSDPANGTVVLTGGSPGAHTGLTYQPDPNYCNNPPGTTPDTFTYTLNPGGDTATVSMTVTCVDDAPVAVADTATVSEDSSANAIDVLANDTDIDAGPKNVASATDPANGTVVLTPAGPGPYTGLTYSPDADYCNSVSGTPDTFSYTLTPGSSSTTVSVTVLCGDDSPVAVADTATVAEDSGPTAIDVLANDTDLDAGPKNVASATDPANGTVVLTPAGPGPYTGLTYQPDANYCNSVSGIPDTFTYTLTPGSSSTNVTVTVTCDDDPPVAVADTATVAEDSGATAIDVLANDTDIDAGPKNVASATDPANGTVVLTPAGPGPYTGLTYQPDANYCNSVSGTPDTFSYTLTPGSSSTTVTVTVTCDDDPPVAVADTATVAEDSGATAIDVLANDTDIDAGPRTVASATDPANGTVVLTPVGPGPYTGLTYQPDANYCNSVSGIPDTFNYTLAPGSSSTTVSVTVTCVNDAPAIDLDADNSGGTTGNNYAITFTEGQAAQFIEDIADATITDLDSTTLTTLTVTLTNLLDPSFEVLDVDLTGFPLFSKTYDTTTDPTKGVLTITATPAQPIADFITLLRKVTYVNTDDDPTLTARTIEFVVNDGTSNSNTATTTVTMAASDDPPVAVADSATVAEDSSATAINVLANDTDVDVGPKNIASATDPANGTVVLTPVGPGPYTGLTYQPDPNYCNSVSGPPDTFSYTLTPGSSSTTVSVTVTCSDDPPVAVADSATVNEDSGANAINVLANDTDIDAGPKNVASATDPANGTVVLTPVGPGPYTGLTYQPDANYCNSVSGIPDTFSYTLTPGSSSTTVTVTVTCVDDSPVAVADSATVLEDAAATAIDVLANDTDIDAGPKNVASATDPANGTVVLTPVGPGPYTGLTYQPDANYCNSVSGPLDTFSYTLTPGGSSTTVSVTVTCVDDSPVAVADSATVLEDAAATAINVLANDTDIDAGPKNVASATDPANGTVVLTPVGPGPYTGLTYQPDPNYCNSVSGIPDTFSYTLTPGSSSTTVTVTVTCVDDPPVAVADSATVIEDSGTNAINVLGNDTDIDGGPINVASATDPANGTVVLTPVGPGPYTGLTYQPDLNYCNSISGPPDTFSYTLTPGSSSTTVSVTVTCVNDAPMLTTSTITYATAGHTQLHVEGKTLPGVASVADPTGADAKAGPFTDVDGPVAPTIVDASGTSTNGGSYDIDPNGSFTYVPPLNFTGTDSFTFQVTDTLAQTAGTINITVTSVVWYVRDIVDANNAAGGDGRSSNAFETIAAAQTASGNNHIIYVFEGNTGTTPLVGGISLKDGQKLWGQGIDLDLPSFPDVVTATNKARLRTTAPSTDTVTVPATAGNRNNVEIRGLDLEATGATSNAIDVTSSGGNTVGVTISSNNVRGATVEGIDLNAGSTGAFSVTVQTNTVTSAGNGIDTRTSSTGTATVTASGNMITSTAGNAFDARTLAGASALRIALDSSDVAAAGTGILVDGTAAGTTTITGFANNVVNGNTAGSGIVLTGPVTFDSTPGGNLDQVLGGATVIGASGNGVGGAGFTASAMTGRLTFTDLDVFADGGAALSIVGTGPLAVATGTQIDLTGGVSTLTAIGPAADLTNLTSNIDLLSLTSTNTATRGVSLTNVADGSSTNAVFLAGAGSITTTAGSAGPAFNVSGGNAKITYGGTITNNGTGRAVSITTWSGDDAVPGDDLLLSGAIDENGSGILVNGNGGSRAITFSGGMDIDTTTGEGFAATSNTNTLGLHITGTNTIDSTSATALRITDTLIGNSDATFRTISSGNNTAAADPASGVVLTNTGTSGGLKVTGTGASGQGGNGTGGLVQNTTSHGISLTNTREPSFINVTIQNTGGSGINGTQVTDFTFDNGTITGAGDANQEANIAFNGSGSLVGNNVNGVVTVTDSVLNTAFDSGVYIESDNGTISDLTISGNSFTSTTADATSKGDAVKVIVKGNATTVANLTRATIANNVIANFPSGAGIQVIGGNSNSTGPGGSVGTPGSGANVISITGNRIAGPSSANRMGTSAIVVSINGGNGASRSQGNFDVSSNGTVANPLANMDGTAILVGHNGYATGTYTMNSNVIVANNINASPGIGGGNGIVTSSAETPDLTWTINSNTISNTDGNGILAVSRGVTGIMKVKIQSNTVAAPLTGVRPGIRVDAGNASSVDDAVCLNISGNTTGGSGGHEGIGLRKQGTNSTINDFGIHGMAATSSPGVEQYVGNGSGQNPGTANGSFGTNGVLLLSATSGFSSCSLP